MRRRLLVTPVYVNQARACQRSTSPACRMARENRISEVYMAAYPKPEAALNATQQPSPALFFETINAYQRTEALKAAIELRVFTAIGNGAATARALAEKCATAERGMRILCDYLVTIGFLTKSEDRYSLTPDSAPSLDQNSPAYMGSAVRFLTAPTLTAGFNDLAATVR